MKVLVSGANSLVGANLVRALIKKRFKVRAFVRTTSDVRSLTDLNVELVIGDVLDIDSVIHAAEGCKIIFHSAAIFSYSGIQSHILHKVATEGTINILEAAKRTKVNRIVLTSSSVVFGSSITPKVLDEKNTSPEQNPEPYVSSKIEQEKVGFKHANKLGIDIVAVYPTLCVGQYDYKLTESNAIIINYLKDPFRSTWLGGCNIVSVEDVAIGHILAALHGKSGSRYILGSENLLWSDVHRIISELCGLKGPLITASHTATYLAGMALEIISKFTTQRPPVTRTQAKMVGRFYWYSHKQAARLGYKPIQARQAIAKAISWLVTSHHITTPLRNSITLSEEVYKERL